MRFGMCATHKIYYIAFASFLYTYIYYMYVCIHSTQTKLASTWRWWRMSNVTLINRQFFFAWIAILILKKISNYFWWYLIFKMSKLRWSTTDIFLWVEISIFKRLKIIFLAQMRLCISISWCVTFHFLNKLIKSKLATRKLSVCIKSSKQVKKSKIKINWIINFQWNDFRGSKSLTSSSTSDNVNYA